MRLSIPFLLTWIYIFILLTPMFAWAEGQKIKIVLELAEKNKVIYGAYDPIRVNLKVDSSYSQKIYIDKGFSVENIFLKMRVVDPTGRLVFPKPRKSSGQYNQMPPLPYGLYDDDPNDSKPGAPVRFAPCKLFDNIDEKKVNIRRIYNLEQPGYYSMQVETSAMIFENGTCNIDAAPRVGLLKPWVGLLKSNTISFCVAGRREVKVDKGVWHKHWVKNNSNKKVKFRIPYENGRTSADYDKDNIYLNCKEKLEVEFFTAEIWAFLSESECAKSLGTEIKNGEYTIAITGWLKSGQPFGGYANIHLKD